MGSSLDGVPVKTLFVRVPQYLGDPKKDPNLTSAPQKATRFRT